MTETAWLLGSIRLTETDWFEDSVRLPVIGAFLLHRKVSGQRRALLFASACCRRVWHLVQSEAARRVVELAEAYADGAVAANDLQAMNDPTQFSNLEDRLYGEAEPRLSMLAYDAILAAKWLAEPTFNVENAGAVGEHTAGASASDFFPTSEIRMRPGSIYPDDGERAKIGRIMRDVFGNPFRPASLDAAHRTQTVVSLARAAYEERQLPSGELDTTRLAILADALEEAGCYNQEILGHLRSPGPHTRGCWPVDLVLGLS